MVDLLPRLSVIALRTATKSAWYHRTSKSLVAFAKGLEFGLHMIRRGWASRDLGAGYYCIAGRVVYLFFFLLPTGGMESISFAILRFEPSDC